MERLSVFTQSFIVLDELFRRSDRPGSARLLPRETSWRISPSFLKCRLLFLAD